MIDNVCYERKIIDNPALLAPKIVDALKDFITLTHDFYRVLHSPSNWAIANVVRHEPHLNFQGQTSQTVRVGVKR